MKKTQPIKERLNAHLDMLEKLEALKLELEYAEEQYGACKSPNYSGMPGGGGGYKGTSETEVIVCRKIELENKVNRKQAEIDRDWKELEPLVEQLKPIETLVINLRYLYGSDWKDVCKSVYGRRKDYALEIDHYMHNVFLIHGKALTALAVLFSPPSDGTPQEVDGKRTEICSCKERIEEFLNEQLHLELNAKTTINKVRNGVNFVGLQIHAGWRKMNRKPLKKMKARIRYIEKQYAAGLIDLEAVQNTMASYYGMMSHCNSYGLRRWIERNITFQRQDKEETR